jgi:hypothetical protein
MISCCFSYTPLSLACKIFVLFVVIIFFAAVLRFLLFILPFPDFAQVFA